MPSCRHWGSPLSSVATGTEKVETGDSRERSPDKRCQNLPQVAACLLSSATTRKNKPTDIPPRKSALRRGFCSLTRPRVASDETGLSPGKLLRCWMLLPSNPPNQPLLTPILAQHLPKTVVFSPLLPTPPPTPFQDFFLRNMFLFYLSLFSCRSKWQKKCNCGRLKLQRFGSFVIFWNSMCRPYTFPGQPHPTQTHTDSLSCCLLRIQEHNWPSCVLVFSVSGSASVFLFFSFDLICSHTPMLWGLWQVC